MPSCVALWAGGFAAELRDDAAGLASCARRASRSPLGSAAGYGTPGLPLDRELTRAKLGLRRGAGAGHCRAAVARQGRSATAVRVHAAHAGPGSPRRRPAALLYAGIRVRDAARIVHHRLVDHAAEAQSRRVRAGARAQRSGAGLPHRSARHFRQAALRLSARPAAHQAAVVPRHRPRAVHGRHHGGGHRWRAFPRRGEIKLDPAIHAAEEANALVAREGIPFREAYRRIGEKYRK